MEHDDIGEVVAQRRRGLEAARRRRLVVDLGVALVDHEQEIMGARKLERALQIVEAGDGALRIGRAAEIEDRRARQHRLRYRLEVRKESRRRGRVEIMDLGAAHHAAAAIDHVVGVGDEDERLLPGLGLRHRDLPDQEQAFLGAGDRQDVALGGDHARRQPIAPRQPLRHRRAVAGRAVHGGIAVPEMGVLGDHALDEMRRRVLGIAHRHHDRRGVGARRLGRQQLSQLGEGVIAEAIETRIVLHADRPPEEHAAASSPSAVKPIL